MPRPRPSISPRLEMLVAERQLFARGDGWQAIIVATQFGTIGRRLPVLLWLLLGSEPLHLDHDPPLRVRTYNERIKKIADRYTPNANDPEHLIWRTAIAHKLKTNVRGNGAQYPDRVLINRERKRERPAKPKKAWGSRPMQSRSSWPPKGSRPFNRRK